MPAVEIRLLDRKSLPEALARMRQWLDHRRYQPVVFRSTFNEADALIHIEFASADEAAEFARAFGGSVPGFDPAAPFEPNRLLAEIAG